MPKLMIEGVGEFEGDNGIRLVLAIEDNDGDINYACGGNARCTTCRMKFIVGEPDKYTKAEYEKLSQTNSIGEYRLSCQCLIDGDMSVAVLDRFSISGRPDPGSRPDDNITPNAEWVVP